jgi:hypothetical protein
MLALLENVHRSSLNNKTRPIQKGHARAEGMEVGRVKGRGNLRCSHSVDSRKLEFSGSFSMGVVMPWPLMFLAIN